ncbi:reverse transcriptase domain, reverse transcriptase zinc-binding domain protein [Tanacetum coccineum]
MTAFAENLSNFIYIKVSNSDTFIASLSNIWIGKMRLHANVARFDRNAVRKTSHTGVKVVNPVDNGDRFQSSNKGTSYANVTKASINVGKGVLKLLLMIVGFMEVFIKYLGGLWVLFEFSKVETRNKFLKHKGISTWFSLLKPWYDDFLVEESLVWLEIEGVPIHAWNNDTFTSIRRKWGDVLFYDDSDSSNRLKDSCKDEEGSMGSFIQDQEEEGEIKENDAEIHAANHDDTGDDNVKFDEEHDIASNNSVEIPHCFSPVSSALKNNQFETNLDALIIKPSGLESVNNLTSNNSHKPIGFSLVERLEERIKVGLALGCWILNDVRIMWIVVYAPQNLSSKIALWSSLANLIDNWDRILVVMGDFNEVQEKEHLSRLASIDVKIDQGIANESDLLYRQESSQILGEIDRKEAFNIAQKAKMKGALEGDENYGFFHAS